MAAEQQGGFERVPMSEATGTLLCDFAAGDLARPLHSRTPDWDEVLRGVRRNGLLGLTTRYLARGAARDAVPEQFRRALHVERYGSAVRMGLLYRHIGTVLAALAAAPIEYLVLKGPALAHQIYPDPDLRMFSDLDLMLHECDRPVAGRALIRLGFAPLEDPSRQRPKLVPQATIYELKYWHDGWQLMVEVHFDDLLNAGLVSRDIRGYWHRAVNISIQGVPTKTLAFDDQLIHLCAHMHYHGYTRLNWFSDVAFLIRDHGAALDWGRMIATVHREEAEVPVYYSLLFLERLLGIATPAGVLAALRPDRFRCWWHERYLPAQRVLSLQPMPRPDFSFYFLPLFKRLLPDLLVMGRRGEKLRYLARLLIPPPSWLRAYYGLGHNQPVARHYLLHPLKLAAHYLAEGHDVALATYGRWAALRRQ